MPGPKAPREPSSCVNPHPGVDHAVWFAGDEWLVVFVLGRGEPGTARDVPDAMTSSGLCRLENQGRAPAMLRQWRVEQPMSDQFENEIDGSDEGSPAPGSIGQEDSRLGRPVLLRRSAGVDENVRGLDGGKPFDSMHSSLRRLGKSDSSLVPANESPVKRRLSAPTILLKTA